MGSATVKVAVLDDGVWTSHPDLHDNMAGIADMVEGATSFDDLPETIYFRSVALKLSATCIYFLGDAQRLSKPRGTVLAMLCYAVVCPSEQSTGAGCLELS